jgi:hypothetical protein
MGITAKEVVDALKAAQNGTAVKGELAGGEAWLRA